MISVTQRALYVGTTSKFSLGRHDLISTTFQHCSNVRCPLGSTKIYSNNHCYFLTLKKIHKD